MSQCHTSNFTKTVLVWRDNYGKPENGDANPDETASTVPVGGRLTMFGLFKTAKWRGQARLLYTTISAVSREPALYLTLGVPDTVEGRFESLSLHVCLVLRRLKALPPPALDVSKDIVDLFFADLDAALRELGVGDLSVGKKIKVLAQAFYGRAKALEGALAAGAPAGALEMVLARNVLGLGENAGDDGGSVAVRADTGNIDTTDLGAPDLGAELAHYVRDAARLLDGQDLDAILRADHLFPPLDTPVFSAADIP